MFKSIAATLAVVIATTSTAQAGFFDNILYGGLDRATWVAENPGREAANLARHLIQEQKSSRESARGTAGGACCVGVVNGVLEFTIREDGTVDNDPFATIGGHKR